MELNDLKSKAYEAGRKLKEIGARVVDCGRGAIQWAIENPDKAAALAATTAAITGGVSKVAKCVNRNVTMRQIEKEKRTRIYDHSLNAYVYTKRPLRADEVEFVNRERRRTGKRVSEVLYDMNMLRK